MTKKTHANGGNNYREFEKDHETYYFPLKKSFQDYIVIPLDLVPWFEVLDKCIQLILLLMLLVIFKFHHNSVNRSISSWKLSKFVQHIIITNLWNPSNHIATSFQLWLQLFEFHLHIYKLGKTCELSNAIGMTWIGIAWTNYTSFFLNNL